MNTMGYGSVPSTLAAIDEAIAPECERCGESMGASPSDWWCSEDCQAGWARGKTHPAPIGDVMRDLGIGIDSADIGMSEGIRSLAREWADATVNLGETLSSLQAELDTAYMRSMSDGVRRRMARTAPAFGTDVPPRRPKAPTGYGLEGDLSIHVAGRRLKRPRWLSWMSWQRGGRS